MVKECCKSEQRHVVPCCHGVSAHVDGGANVARAISARSSGGGVQCLDHHFRYQKYDKIRVVTARKSTAKAAAWLGASQPAGALIIVLFVPSRDRDGQDIDHDFWVTGALERLGTLFRGATAFLVRVASGAMTNAAARFATDSQPL